MCVVCVCSYICVIMRFVYTHMHNNGVELTPYEKSILLQIPSHIYASKQTQALGNNTFITRPVPGSNIHACERANACVVQPHLSMHTGTGAHTNTQTHTCIHISEGESYHILLHICFYRHAHTHTFIHTCTHVHTHTCTHTSTSAW